MADPAPDPALVEKWLRARSHIRGLPQPVADNGGLRVDTNLPTERRRHVFAHPCEGIRRLGAAIDEPLVFIKLCGTARELMPLLPGRWALQQQTHMMICTTPIAAKPTLPAGYSLDITMQDGVATARIVAADHSLAASGRAGGWDDVFVYDQIVTAGAHQRRGLGRAVMAALAAAGRAPDQTQLLVATPAGRALYATLGWQDHCPYSTAVIP